ncbi:MAG: hypothetical protein Ct9H300mP10_01830 [Methanobacteriota archaeon]|nr:MAG: hypothetical protein Ct9H300mP10_01830 [Euryarchaeota archaeon]
MGLLGQLIVTMMPVTPRFFVQWVAKRYVAGSDMAQRHTTDEGNERGRGVLHGRCAGRGDQLDGEAGFFIEEYSRLIDSIAENELDANISIKPTAFGLLIEPESALGKTSRDSSGRQLSMTCSSVWGHGGPQSHRVHDRSLPSHAR